MAELAAQLKRVMTQHALGAGASIVSAGCGDFLVADVVAQAIGAGAARHCMSYAADVAHVAPTAPKDMTRWAQVCAPCVAVATLRDEELL